MQKVIDFLRITLEIKSKSYINYVIGSQGATQISTMYHVFLPECGF